MRTPQQALRDAIDSGAVQAWIDGKKIEWQSLNHLQDNLTWRDRNVAWNGMPFFDDTSIIWRAAPPEPPKPTIADWQPIETRPQTGRAIFLWSDGAVCSVRLPSETTATHWAPVPAPPGDKQ
jgi:hypothetical protein